MNTKYEVGDYIFIKDKWVDGVFQIKTIDNKTYKYQLLIGIKDGEVMHHFISSSVRLATKSEIKIHKLKHMFVN